MAVLDSELLMLASLVVSNETTNGGRMDNNSSISTGVANNVWDDVFEADRTAGVIHWRKTFFKVANDDDDDLSNPRVWIDVLTPGDDYVCFYEGSQTDTQGTAGAGITGTDAYGCSSLNTNVVATDTTIVVDVEHVDLATGANVIFRIGDTIRITNKDTPTSGTGTQEFHTLTGVSNVDTVITLTIGAPGLANAYNTSDNTYGTRVMTVYEPANVTGSVDNYSYTGSGSFNSGSYPVNVDNIGTVEQEITITFSSATVFTAVSDVAGISLTGDTLVTDDTWEPNNPDVSKPFLSMEHNGFSGVATSDELVFETHPASFAIWQKRRIPAGSTSLTGNRTVFAFSGQSSS